MVTCSSSGEVPLHLALLPAKDLVKLEFLYFLPFVLLNERSLEMVFQAFVRPWSITSKRPLSQAPFPFLQPLYFCLQLQVLELLDYGHAATVPDVFQKVEDFEAVLFLEAKEGVKVQSVLSCGAGGV